MDYNSRLTTIVDKGLCGDPEICDSGDILKKKVKKLAVLIQGSKKVVAFTGAGISTSCGIPDFRGPNGVWTKEQRGEVVVPNSGDTNLFDTARPTFTHYALACLLHLGVVSHIASQNVDSLHLRSGVPESQLSELHGNIFKEQCASCGHQYLRDFDVGGMGLKPTGRLCDRDDCQGILRDMAYDWDTELDDDIFLKVENEMDKADIVLSMGTSLRVEPAGSLPERVLAYNKARSWKEGKLVIVNLQKTDRDKLADVRLFHYCDDVMRFLCRELGLTIVDISQIRGKDVSSWYSIEEGSVLEAMTQFRQEEQARGPRRVSKPRVILEQEDLPNRKSKRNINNKNAVKEESACTAASGESVDKLNVFEKGVTLKSTSSGSSSANNSVTSKSSTSTKKARAKSKVTQSQPPAEKSSSKPFSFAEVLAHNEHKFSLQNFAENKRAQAQTSKNRKHLSLGEVLENNEYKFDLREVRQDKHSGASESPCK